MLTLVSIDGSRASQEAVRYAACGEPDTLVLLYVSCSGRAADLERGRFLLRQGCESCAGPAHANMLRTRLEIGDRRLKVAEVARAEGCDLVVLAAFGINGFPHLGPVDPDAVELTRELGCPVVLVLPNGCGDPTAWAPARMAGQVARAA